MLVQPGDIDTIPYCLPLTKVVEHMATVKGVNNTKVVQGSVKTIDATSVTLEDGTKLTADAIVVALGGQYASGAIWKATPDQTTKEKRKAAMKELRAQVAKAKGVVVAGAGPTGLEVAGEVQAAFPQAKVVMVGKLLPNHPEALRKRMRTALAALGVELVEGEHVDVDTPDSQGVVKTREGTSIEGIDIVLNAAGFSFSGASIAGKALQKDVTSKGQFDCKPTLQLKSCDTVFCTGDILAVPDGCFADVKGILHAELTSETVGKNIVHMLKSKKPLVDFQWSKTPILKPMMTAMGPDVAVGYMGLFAFMENFLGRKLKCNDYYMGIQGSAFGKGKTW